jgi:hypothetical protein
MQTTLTRPMTEFDPTQPALLYDRLHDEIVTWDWNGEGSDLWKRSALVRPDGAVEWRGRIFAGWDEPLGG